MMEDCDRKISHLSSYSLKTHQVHTTLTPTATKGKKRNQRCMRTRSVSILMTVVKYVQSGRTLASSWKKSDMI